MDFTSKKNSQKKNQVDFSILYILINVHLNLHPNSTDIIWCLEVGRIKKLIKSTGTPYSGFMPAAAAAVWMKIPMDIDEDKQNRKISLNPTRHNRIGVFFSL